MAKVNFKLDGVYSSKTITKNLDNFTTSGQVIGGEHTIENESYRFVMLSDGAWRLM